MKTQISGNSNRGEKILATSAKAALLATLVVFGSLVADRPAVSGGGGTGSGAAAAVGNAGLGACSSSGKALYDCVANALDAMSNEARRAPEAQSALRTAASELRAAANKVQALSAITQCRSAIAGILRQVRAAGREGAGLSAIAGVLSRAAALIQSKG